MQVSGQVSGSATGAAMIQQMRDRLFARADKDGDGGLSLDEFKAATKRPPGAGAADAPARSAASATDAAFARMDTDGDGKLSSAELQAGRKHHQDGGGVSSAGLAVLLGAQESAGAQVATGGGLPAVMARLLQAYGGGTASAA